MLSSICRTSKGCSSSQAIVKSVFIPKRTPQGDSITHFARTAKARNVSSHGRLKPVHRPLPSTSAAKRHDEGLITLCQYSTRPYSSNINSQWDVEPVELKYDLTEPAKLDAGLEGQSLVICHGLFGSKQNWRSLAKAFAQKLGIPVYTVDLRNHGTSPHAEPHTYAAMATDLDLFMRQRGLENGVNLMGHSMGGKAVMAYTLNSNFNKPLRSLTVVDMSPAQGKISPEFAAYNEGMKDVERAKVKSKAEADKILQKVEPILATRQFLLTNAKLSPEGHLIFRVPIDLLTKAIPQIGDFPYTPPETSPQSTENDDENGFSKGTFKSPIWTGPTLFLKGEHSKYLNRHNIPIAERYFPKMRLEVLDAGHWVHAEQPSETVRLVDGFVRGVGVGVGVGV